MTLLHLHYIFFLLLIACTHERLAEGAQCAIAIDLGFDDDYDDFEDDVFSKCLL